jgi:hypothetical protein
MYLDVLFEIALARKTALREAGVPEEAYDRVLRAWRASRAGKPLPDPSWQPALDARKDALAAAEFGENAFFDEIRTD